MEASTESRVADVNLLTVALSTLSTAPNATTNKESCLTQIQSAQSQSYFSGCPVVNDTILCWPQTLPNTTAIISCFTQYLGINYDGSQNASRFCHANGTWDNHANYDQCRHIEDDITDGMDRTQNIVIATHIYSAGYTLSLIALSLGLAVFIHFKDLRCLRNTIHANLFLTYILSALLWIIPFTLGLTANELSGIGCKCMVVLLHYFSLTNFFWMLVEGLYLYMLVVETFSGDNIRFKMYAFIGWGSPAIIIAIWTSVKPFAPDVDEMNLKRVPMKCTWLQESHVDWIFHGPEVACLLINLFFLIRIMWVLIIKLRSATTAETRQYKKASKALLVLIPLLGITYLVVWYVPENGAASLAFNAIRAALLSTQGFSVALLYCFLNSEVKQALHHRITIWREKRNIGMDTQMDYRKHRNGLSKEYSSPRSRTESIRLTLNGSSIP